MGDGKFEDENEDEDERFAQAGKTLGGSSRNSLKTRDRKSTDLK
jgi:hypothetical protein